MNNYIEVQSCRCCGNNVECILDLSDQPLANEYHDNTYILDKYPLKLNLCDYCYHLQLSVVVNPDIMFKKYLYVSGTTQTLKDYFNFFARFTVERFKFYNNRSPKNILDIACNDGTQLDSYKKYIKDTHGIDPAINLYENSSKNHKVICDYYPSEKIDEKYDLIIAQNVFAHTHNIGEFLNNCYKNLSDTGILYIQTSQSNMVLNNEFDTAYHEHLSFFNTLSMKIIVEKNGLHLNNVYKFDIHGSSYIFEISKIQKDSNLQSILELEKKSGLYEKSTYFKFANNATEIVNNLATTINEHKIKNYKIVGYGAAAKGMTILNFGNIYFDFIIDDNPLKHNLYTPGTNYLIKSIDYLTNYNNEKILFVPLAWNFYDEIKERIKKIRINENDLYLKYFPNIQINN